MSNSAAKWIPKNSVIVAMYGNSAGRVATTAIPLTTNQACCNLIIDNEIADYRFVYYSLLQSYTVLHDLSRGAAQKNLNAQQIKDFELPLPPRPVQDRIAGILSDYDAAIANCRKQIALLEEAAMRIYKEWFRDGKGERKRIGDVINFDPPTKLKKGVKRFSVPMSALQVNSMVLDKNEFEITTGNSGSKFRNGDTLLARITPCLENGKTAFVFGVDEDGACGSTEFIVMRSKCLTPYIVYLLARTESFRKVAIASMSGADGRQRARKEVIADYEILVPSAEGAERLGVLHKPMFLQIEMLANQIRSLTEARDRLLPKLMKGEVAVVGEQPEVALQNRLLPKLMKGEIAV